jgi:predicted amidohydrolase
VRVALAQIPVEDGNLAKNMELAAAAASEAKRRNVQLLNFPEAADRGWLYQQARRDALPIPGPYTEFLADLARRHQFWISAGCFEKAGDHVYNSAVLVGTKGELVIKHRKIDTLPWLTKDLCDAGRADDIKVVDTQFGTIGMTICADNFNLDRPRRVASLGAWLLIAPHGFAAEPSKSKQNSKEYLDHILNVAGKAQLWVIATDAVLGTVQGGAWKGWRHSGCSVLARPDGTAAAVGKFLEPDLVVFDIPAAN